MPKQYDPNEINMAEEIVKSIWKKTHQCSLCRNRVVMNGFSAGPARFVAMKSFAQKLRV